MIATDKIAVSEAIVLKLRRPDSHREYLYPQIFAGTCYVVASLFLFELQRRRIPSNKADGASIGS